MGNIISAYDVLTELGVTSPTATETNIVERVVKRVEGSIRSYLQYDPFQTERTEYYPQRTLTGYQGVSILEATDSVAYERRIMENAADQIIVRHIPIRGDVRIWIDSDGRFNTNAGAFASETEITQGSDFWPAFDGLDDDGNQICRDGVIRSIGLWTIEPGSIKITYTGGYSKAELQGNKSLVDASPIWDVALSEALEKTNKILSRQKHRYGFASGPLKSENLGDYSYTVDSESVNSKSLSSLSPGSRTALAPFVNYGIMLGG